MMIIQPILDRFKKALRHTETEEQVAESKPKFYLVQGYRLGDPEEEEEEAIVAVWDGDLPEFIDDSIMFQVSSLSEIEEAIETGEPLVDDYIVLAYEDYKLV